jgi:hypothetical protein
MPHLQAEAASCDRRDVCYPGPEPRVIEVLRKDLEAGDVVRIEVLDPDGVGIA